jgi:hypothetical protein
MRLISSSVVGLVMHPLLGKLVVQGGEPVGWGCERSVPDASSYKYAPYPPPAVSADKMSSAQLLELEQGCKSMLVAWMINQGAKSEHPFCAVFDAHNKLIFRVNQIVSRHGKACLVLIFHTRHRIHTKDFPEMFWYANKIHSVCVEQYAMSPTTLLLNAYYKSAAEGGGFGVSAISRPTTTSRPRRRAPTVSRLQPLGSSSYPPLSSSLSLSDAPPPPS